MCGGQREGEAWKGGQGQSGGLDRPAGLRLLCAAREALNPGKPLHVCAAGTRKTGPGVEVGAEGPLSQGAQ